MRATTIDPRDQTHEFDAPCYRVIFWESAAHSEEWELDEADLDEVLEWVRQRSGGRSHSLWVFIKSGNDVQHVRLRGTDPTAPADTWPAWAVEAR